VNLSSRTANSVNISLSNSEFLALIQSQKCFCYQDFPFLSRIKYVEKEYLRVVIIEVTNQNSRNLQKLTEEVCLY
jgi:hypothetical protein